jgi:hypothetical protein
MKTSAEKIEQMVLGPAARKIADIKVLRTWGSIPSNEQAGPTCGIYALDAALQIKGIFHAPRKKEYSRLLGESPPPDYWSLRKAAKHQGLSQTGEISKAVDMVTLAASFGISVTSPQFASEAELWRIIQGAIANGHGVVFPYACAGDDGAPAWSRTSNGFTHWCLLFGYVTFSYAQLREPLNHVFMTTYGKYHEVSPYQLFKSNQGIQDLA